MLHSISTPCHICEKCQCCSSMSVDGISHKHQIPIIWLLFNTHCTSTMLRFCIGTCQEATAHKDTRCTTALNNLLLNTFAPFQVPLHWQTKHLTHLKWSSQNPSTLWETAQHQVYHLSLGFGGFMMKSPNPCVVASFLNKAAVDIRHFLQSVKAAENLRIQIIRRIMFLLSTME